MAVRDALLVLLLNGPAYGFQLHGGLAERTGGRRQVNVGQIYSTLDRLSGRGLVESAGETDDGLPLYRITAAGRAAAATWLAGEDATGADPWHETVDRVLIALSMPSVEGARVVEAERSRWTGRREAAAAALGSASGAGIPAAGRRLAGLSAAADLGLAESALHWLDEVARTDAAGLAFAPSAERPRRGRRPAHADEGTAVVSAGHATDA
ncbi:MULTISPECIES: PadR family transcriptional regulator [unclassified Agromyces]|uniref:PadR family transcriptional regulator n=1 Tax=unclassified Agromyces TaxID=2639701 RepID=UPI003014D08F